MKAVVSVIGKDQRGIISGVSTRLYEFAINVQDISQTIMQNAYLRLGEAGIKFSRNRITHADVACFEIDERQTLRNRIGFC